MATPTRTLTTPPGRISSGRVRATSEGAIAVDLDGGPIVARRAASCLLAPRPGDHVLCASVDGGAYVLAVLEREGASTEIDVDGDLRLRARGSVQLDAADDVEVSAGRAARFRAGVINTVADRVTTVARELRLLGDELTMDGTRIRQVSSVAERVAGSLRERLGQSHREIDEGEHVRAGAMTWSVRSMLRAHAETAIHSAKKLIKLDGEQIHLG